MDFSDDELLDESYVDVELMTKDCINEIRLNMSIAARYEQLAEECTELAHAALKKARKIRNESPTPLDMKEINQKLSEEVSDVELMIDICGLKSSWSIIQQKADRCLNRLQKRTQSNENN